MPCFEAAQSAVSAWISYCSPSPLRASEGRLGKCEKVTIPTTHDQLASKQSVCVAMTEAGIDIRAARIACNVEWCVLCTKSGGMFPSAIAMLVASSGGFAIWWLLRSFQK